jgi:hypothetical protein
MKLNHCIVWGLTLTANLLSGCGLHVSSWIDPQFTDRPMGKTMVLGAGKTVEISRQYETLFVNRLTELVLSH